MATSQVESVVAAYGLSVDEFLASDVDDLPSDELRDVWLVVKGARAPDSGVAGGS